MTPNGEGGLSPRPPSDFRPSFSAPLPPFPSFTPLALARPFPCVADATLTLGSCHGTAPS